MSSATYDGNGLRASSTMTPAGGNAVTSDYVWDEIPDTPRLLMDSADAYIYINGNTPAEQIDLSSGQITYLATDALGSVRGIINSAGAITGSTNYDAWGNPAGTDGLTSATPFGFAGSYTDPDGLLYLIDRYYDPATGQFLSVDSDVAQTQQPYAYANDDPVDTTDPSGDKPGYFPDHGGIDPKITIAPGGKLALSYTEQHETAVFAAATDIWFQLTLQGYSPWQIARGLELERPVPRGSKKIPGNDGWADITWEAPDVHGILVWEMKIWTKANEAYRDVGHYVAAFNLSGIPAAFGFLLTSVIYVTEGGSGQIIRVFSYGFGVILYNVLNPPRPRPRPRREPQPQPEPPALPYVRIQWKYVTLAVLAGVALRFVVIAVAAG